MTISKLINKALLNNEFDSLLLGRGDYIHLPRWTCASGGMDLAALYPELCEFNKNERNISKQVNDLLLKACNKYETIIPVAAFIMLETLRIKNGQVRLGLCLDIITEKLKSAILTSRNRLRLDKNGDGNQWSDGLFGELRRINAITVDLGGKTFMPFSDDEQPLPRPSVREADASGKAG
jgi:hypothetical protein